ncbi:MAG TPA: alkaline phosphatase family protein [Gemmatimonadaceae bacterium]|nr:alkaline phosphatase family protein [Gemmatimonadaceae bacterium]
MTHRFARLLALLAALPLLAGPALAQARRAPAPIGHVFVIVLENKGYDTTFGPNTSATYLADTLVRAGALLRQYYGTGHVSLDNYIAMVSGLAPSRETQIDCPRYIDFVQTGTAADGQPIGTGCVYPAHIKTVANQLEAKQLQWRAFMEDMGADSTRERATCGHPALGTPDITQRATPLDQYATKHDPFVYFHAIIDSPSCDRNVVPLPRLADALKSIASTPQLSFISPNLCHDGHDRPCRNGEPGALVSANLFLEHWVPRIVGSPAFKKDGMLVITFDEALSHDTTSCCGERPGPNVLKPGIGGSGGGRVGAVVLSPFVKPGTVTDRPYNHYALLRTIEDVFGLDYLGYAGRPGLDAFGSDIFRSTAAGHQ